MTCLLRIIFTDRQIPYLSPRLPCLWSKVGKRLYAADNVRNVQRGLYGRGKKADRWEIRRRKKAKQSLSSSGLSICLSHSFIARGNVFRTP